MKIGLIGKKIGMTRIFQEDGQAIAVTVIEVDPSIVTGVKTAKTDGYSALQLGHGDIKEKKVNKAQKSFFSKVGVGLKKTMYEVRADQDIEGVEAGDLIGVDNCEVGDYVDIMGVSIGKGFQGVMKRYNFAGGRASHGDSTGRRTGSIGQSAYPGRVFKNMKMPGQMGNERVTVQNLPIVKIDSENNLLVVHGAIPGSKNNLVRVNLSVKKSADKELKVTKAQEEAPEVKDEAPQDVAPETSNENVQDTNASDSVSAESAPAEETKKEEK